MINEQSVLKINKDSAGTVSQRLPLTKLVSLCRQNIQDGLGKCCIDSLEASIDKAVQMSLSRH